MFHRAMHMTAVGIPAALINRPVASGEAMRQSKSILCIPVNDTRVLSGCHFHEVSQGWYSKTIKTCGVVHAGLAGLRTNSNSTYVPDTFKYIYFEDMLLCSAATALYSAQTRTSQDSLISPPCVGKAKYSPLNECSVLGLCSPQGLYM